MKKRMWKFLLSQQKRGKDAFLIQIIHCSKSQSWHYWSPIGKSWQDLQNFSTLFVRDSFLKMIYLLRAEFAITFIAKCHIYKYEKKISYNICYLFIKIILSSFKIIYYFVIAGAVFFLVIKVYYLPRIFF
jgi:hypothetical protein